LYVKLLEVIKVKIALKAIKIILKAHLKKKIKKEIL